MKSLLAIFISSVLVVSGYSQTRNVLVNSNNAVVSPTNFWSVDASNARTGLGLGTAATNPASAFQPSSGVLSNLSSSNAVNLTNLRATNIVGTIPASNISSLSLTNILGTLAISNGGTGATNAATARTNLELGWPALTNSNTATALLGYNTNNGNVVMPSSITFSNNVDFSKSILATTNGVSAGGTLFAGSGSTISFYSTEDQSRWRTNLGLGWTALTNTSASGFGAALYGSNTNPVLVNTNGEVVSPTNFWQVAPIVTRFVEFEPSTNATTNIVAARNLHIHSLALAITGVTSTIALPTNNSFNGDIALVVHQGPTSSVTAIRQAGAGTNLITLNQPEQAVEFVYYNSEWQFNHNLSYVEPIFFSGTNAVANAAASRTNLGLGATNDVTFNNITIADQNLTLSHGPEDDVFVRNESGGLELGSGSTPYVRVEPNTETFTFYVPASFSTTTNAAITRTNLGLGANAIVTFQTLNATQLQVTSGTNLYVNLADDVSEFFVPLQLEDQLAVVGAATFGTNVTVGGALTATSTVTAKTNLIVEGRLDFTTNATNSNPATNNQIQDFIEIRVGTNAFFLPLYK